MTVMDEQNMHNVLHVVDWGCYCNETMVRVVEIAYMRYKTQY